MRRTLHRQNQQTVSCQGSRPFASLSLSRAAAILLLACLSAPAISFGQQTNNIARAELPDAPMPQNSQAPATPTPQPKPVAPCPGLLAVLPFPGKIKKKKTGSETQESAGENSAAQSGSSQSANAAPGIAPCSTVPIINWYARFLNGPEVKPLTPLEKAHLAARDVIDPFNFLTIVGTSAIYAAANSHSAFGPGMKGFGKYVGVNYTEDITNEFFGTFVIASIAHQDPHYHRMPNAGIKRRIAHAIYQVVWTQGDNGKEMLNYDNLVGFAIDDEIGNFYVPGWRTDAGATASRYVIGLSTAPIENIVTEFLPDVASHIHLRVVLIQDIINQVARTGGPAGQ